MGNASTLYALIVMIIFIGAGLFALAIVNGETNPVCTKWNPVNSEYQRDAGLWDLFFDPCFSSITLITLLIMIPTTATLARIVISISG